MPGQMEPAWRPQPRGTWVAGLREVDRGAPLGPLLLSLRLRGSERGLALLGMQSGLCPAALLAEPSPFLRRRHQNSGVQPLPILDHSPSPRACFTAAIFAGSNHDPSDFEAGRSVRFGAPGDEYDTSNSGPSRIEDGPV